MPPETQPTVVRSQKRLRLPGGFRTLAGVLFVAIAVMLFLWKPWQANIKASERTVSVTGDTTVTATPDQYVFSPSYDFTNASKPAALSDMTKKSDEIIAKLKALGVADRDIKSNSSGYANGSYYLPVQTNGTTNTYTLDLTITLHDAALAQKVQDYLVTTSPTGQVSPNVNFSTAKQKQLEAQARSKAEQDARAKADQSATNLGFRVGAVKSVVDGSLNGGINPCGGGASGLCAGVDNSTAGTAKPQLSVQPGQNDLTYSVTVVYYIK